MVLAATNRNLQEEVAEGSSVQTFTTELMFFKKILKLTKEFATEMPLSSLF